MASRRQEGGRKKENGAKWLGKWPEQQHGRQTCPNITCMAGEGLSCSQRGGEEKAVLGVGRKLIVGLFPKPCHHIYTRAYSNTIIIITYSENDDTEEEGGLALPLSSPFPIPHLPFLLSLPGVNSLAGDG